jgi:hypothetical protein
MKPKLLFIRSTASDRALFIRTHLREHVKCLSLFFDVILITSDDCDYARLCEIHRPDLALFESGTYVSLEKRRYIRNTEAFPEIPKLGLCNCDAYCETRKVFLADMYRWNVDTFFTISVSMAEYTPEISDSLFVWPNFADGDVYRDYGERKNIPVLFSGSRAAHYPWRNRIFKVISNFYPSLTCPHFGWGGDRPTKRTIFGEEYARLLNASVFVPSCGTIANDLVRKHFEIPASKACLLAQQSPALEAAGFLDMQNCVFADEHNVLDKLDYLFSNPDELESITEEGYKLVHSNHLMTHRNQLLQWFTLHRHLGSDQRIVQPGPFEPLVVVHKGSGIRNSHICVDGFHRQLLRLGDEKLQSGRYSEAKEFFTKCLNYTRTAEPHLRLAIANLLEGDADAAQHWIFMQIEITLERHGAPTPDPVEWAYAILVELCRGNESKALKYSTMFPYLRHSELDRARFVTAIAARREVGHLTCLASSRLYYSVHQLPEMDINDWIKYLCRMLNACGQERIVERITSAAHNYQSHVARDIKGDGLDLVRNEIHVTRKQVLSISRALPHQPLRLAPIKQFAKGVLQRAERRFGYFLPYKQSRARFDDFYSNLEKMSRDCAITAVVIIGACPGCYVTEACLQGVRDNPNRPVVFCVGFSATAFAHLQRQYPNCRHTQFDRSGMESIRHAINESSSLVVIDGSEISGDAHQCDEVGRPKIIVLDDINNSCTSKVHQALLTCREYTLFDHNPMRAGYCIFEWIGADRLHEPENSLPQQSFPEIDEAEPSYRVQEYGGTA